MKFLGTLAVFLVVCQPLCASPCAQYFSSIPESGLINSSIADHLVARPTKRFLDDMEALGAEPELRADFRQPLTVLKAAKIQNRLGVMRSLRHWDTQVYYSATARPDATGKIPLVDPLADAVMLIFTGSGTMNTTGGNQMQLINQLPKFGFSAISFDYPFHARGPRQEKYRQLDYTVNWIRKMVLELKEAGKPVYLMGHSFGPEIIFELLYRWPNLVDGALAMSPAGYTKELEAWYKRKTVKMKFGTDTPANTMAGEWAYALSQQMTWKNSFANRSEDPTVQNPNLRLRIILGDRDEYHPAPLDRGVVNGPTGAITFPFEKTMKRFFANSQTVLEPGVGHMVFNHADRNGHNLVYREVLALVDKSPEEIPALTKAKTDRSPAPVEWISYMYSFDAVFRSWFDLRYSSRYLKELEKTADNKKSGEIMRRFEEEYQGLIEKLAEYLDKATHLDLSDQVVSMLKNPKIRKSPILVITFLTALEDMPPSRREIVEAELSEYLSRH